MIRIVDSGDFHVEEAGPKAGLPTTTPYRLVCPDGRRLFACEYQRPALAATVVVQDRKRGMFLLIRRKGEPFAGRWAFPGGFIEGGREDIYQTAARELREEAGIFLNPSAFHLVDVRSSPRRDPRDHVVDVGFYAEVEEAEALAGDDAEEARWASRGEMDAIALAFDHRELWNRVKTGRLGG